MSGSKALPKIDTTPTVAFSASSITATAGGASSSATTTTRHKSRGSFASPVEVLAKSPTARRMSQSTFSQNGTVLPEGLAVSSILDHPQMLVATLIASIMFSGILYSLIFSTSLDTSLPTSHLTYDRLDVPYLARKSNLPNQVFVKYSWGWTSLAFLFHFISSPPSASPRSARLLAYALCTATWLIFTTWFFGAGLGDRIIALSGGRCAITIPAEWGLEPRVVRHLLPPDYDNTAVFLKGSSTGSPFLLPLPASFCSSNTALTASSHPELFALLKDFLQPSILSRTRMPRPRWHKGFDISGHAFLLTIATMLLTKELAPSWRNLLSGRSSPIKGAIGRGGLVHFAATAFATAMVGLWLVMLGTTAIYFHNPSEKLSGLGFGLATIVVVNLLTPQNSSILESLPAAFDSMADNENSARRGRVVDEGVIIDNDVDEALGHPKSE